VINVGLIGAGRWGVNFIKSIKNNKSYSLCAVASKNPTTKNLVDSSCRIFESYIDLLNFHNLQAVIIATPPKNHFAYIKLALINRIPVLVEKPLTCCLKEASEVIELSKKYETLVMVDHIHTYSHAYQLLKKNLCNLGKIYAIESYAGNFGPYRSDVNVLWDWSSHDISMLLDLLNAKYSDVNIISYFKKDNSIGESLDIKLNIKGVAVNLLISNFIEKTRVFRVYCEGGIIEYDDLHEDKVKMYSSQEQKKILCGSYIKYPVNPEPALSVVLDKFAYMVNKNHKSHLSLSMGLEIVKVISSIEKKLILNI
jgi:predicted dehydrogenase